MPGLDDGSGANNPYFQFGMARCHGEVFQSDSLNAYSLKAKTNRPALKFIEKIPPA
jgi:hypothetical protein